MAEPINQGEDERGPYYQVGDRGRKIRYQRGNRASRSRARSQALLRARQSQTRNPTRSSPARGAERRRGSRTNRPGSASGTRGGIKITAEVEQALRDKVRAHNAENPQKRKRVDLGMLKAVYRRGAGAFSASHGRNMTRNQWAMARVNAYLRIVRTGRARKGGSVFDTDLLPKGHPRRTED